MLNVVGNPMMIPVANHLDEKKYELKTFTLTNVRQTRCKIPKPFRCQIISEKGNKESHGKKVSCDLQEYSAKA
jgi:hypothetical protein